MKTSIVIHAVFFVSYAHGHGIFWTPNSRASLSEEGGYIVDATSIIAEPMPDVTESSRDYPGNRPFAEPGVSVSNVGPCGQQNYSPFTNWNHPANNWGEIQATYTSGDIVTLEWCVSNAADHGGLYSYRICSDDAIVAKFIDPDHVPSTDEMDDLEECFQEGILSCADVPGQECPVHPDCEGTGWGCENATDWFSCGPKDEGRCMSKGQGTCSCHGGDGSLLRDQVKLPNFVSNHTLLGFRWDCEDTAQLWVHCADIALV